MSMTRSEARTVIRANTDHEGASDTQVTTTQLDTWIDLENKLLAREVALIAPTLYTKTDDEQELASGDTDGSLNLPDDFERIVRIEKQVSGDVWYPLSISDGLSPHTGSTLTAREEEDCYIISPDAIMAGTYRLVYVRQAVTMSDDSDTLDVPSGCEDVLIERVCARVRGKLDEDPSLHLQNADRTWRVQKQALRRRYGKSPEPGIRPMRRW